MKPAVLCISRNELTKQNIDTEGYGIFPFNLTNVPQDGFHFVNRKVVDSSESDWFKIGCELPQILAYITVKCGNEYLTYSRAKGAEARLHGTLSLGFGGHCDIDDSYALVNLTGNLDITYQDILKYSSSRELEEELHFTKDIEFKTDSIILDTTNDVGKVHLGLPILIEINSKDDIKADPSEISLPEWKTKDQLVSEINSYENWSQLIINSL